MYYGSAQRGFTLIELMVVVAVLAIGAAFAVPAFQQVIENNRLATEANRFYSTVTFARSEAVRLGEDVSLTAATGGFGSGWCVLTAGDCDDANVLRQFEASSVSYDATANQLTFNARGEMTNANFQMAIEPENCQQGETDKRRSISVSLSGRASISREDC